MSKDGLGTHSLRLNLENEQHRRIEMVLVTLNKDVHKSINQFLINAADHYIDYLENGSFSETGEGCGKKESPYITRDELDELRREIKDEVKNEMILILGAALAGGRDTELVRCKSAGREEPTHEQADSIAMELASAWG